MTRKDATASDLDTVRGIRTLFGHQSVGRNILDALPGVAASAGGRSVPVSAHHGGALGVGITEFSIGRNGDPVGKIAEFDETVRAVAAAGAVDVALFKFCFADFEPTAVAPADVFELYRRTLSSLEADLPETTFVHATVPVVTDRTLRDRLSNALGRSPHRLPRYNVRREAYNRLVRTEYAQTGRLLDVAEIMAAGPDDARSRVRRHRGEPYLAMHPAFASDPGHLNPRGGARLAHALVGALAGAASERR